MLAGRLNGILFGGMVGLSYLQEGIVDAFKLVVAYCITVTLLRVYSTYEGAASWSNTRPSASLLLHKLRFLVQSQVVLRVKLAQK